MRVRLCRNPSTASIASYLHTSVSMLNACQLNKYKGYVDLSTGPTLYNSLGQNPVNLWDCFFLQPQAELHELEKDEPPVWVWENSLWRSRCQHEWELPWNAVDAISIETLQRVVPGLLVARSIVIRRASAIFQEYGLDHRNTIAIAHRGTDKHVEATVAPIESYFPIIDSIRASRPGIKIWCQPEEIATVDKIKLRYADAVVIPEFHSTDQVKLMSDKSNPKSGYEKCFDAVTLMVMFSMCAWLLKNCANLSDLAAGLSKGEVIHVI